MQGKYLEIMFDGHGQPVGAQITNYLLEKVSYCVCIVGDQLALMVGLT
jgi:hypothetical protein